MIFHRNSAQHMILNIFVQLMDTPLNLPFCSKMTKAADQGLVERRSFRFLVTGEEDEDHQQFDRTQYGIP